MITVTIALLEVYTRFAWDNPEEVLEYLERILNDLSDILRAAEEIR